MTLWGRIRASNGPVRFAKFVGTSQNSYKKSKADCLTKPSHLSNIDNIHLLQKSPYQCISFHMKNLQVYEGLLSDEHSGTELSKVNQVRLSCEESTTKWGIGSRRLVHYYFTITLETFVITNVWLFSSIVPLTITSFRNWTTRYLFLLVGEPNLTKNFSALSCTRAVFAFQWGWKIWYIQEFLVTCSRRETS